MDAINIIVLEYGLIESNTLFIGRGTTKRAKDYFYNLVISITPFLKVQKREDIDCLFSNDECYSSNGYRIIVSKPKVKGSVAKNGRNRLK